MSQLVILCDPCRAGFFSLVTAKGHLADAHAGVPEWSGIAGLRHVWVRQDLDLSDYSFEKKPASAPRAPLLFRGTRQGITATEYEQILASQGGTCAICGEAEQNDRLLAIDHDHETNEVRGLLCAQCNLLLGHLEAGRISRDWLDRVEDYLSSGKER